MQIPILSGIYADGKSDFRMSYPVNMKPVIKDTGISEGYLRPVDGVVKTGIGPGKSRGAINWGGVHYRVMGSKLCIVNEFGRVTIIGDVGDDGEQVSFAYSFDRLAIASAKILYYVVNGTLSPVTDPDIGNVLDVVWVDGFFVTTDGAFLVTTELNNPFEVNPLKYGSSEIDPDPVVGLVKQRNEIYAINRYTIEVFDNLGGALFPFGRIEGAQIQRGAFGAHNAIAYEGGVAFLGSGVGESPGIFIASKGTSQKISSREIDELLASYTEKQLSKVVLEVVNDLNHALLWVRLPDKTLVFDLQSTQAAGQAVWYIMRSKNGPYRAVDVIWCYNSWGVGDRDSTNIGKLDSTISTHFGDTAMWEFSTKIIYSGSKGAVIHSLELVGLTSTEAEQGAYISTSYSLDGRLWSQQRPVKVGKRMVWRRQGSMRDTRIQRFNGDSRAFLSVARLEAEIEGLSA